MRFGERYLFDPHRWSGHGLCPCGDQVIAIDYIGGRYEFAGLSVDQLELVNRYYHAFRALLPQRSGTSPCLVSGIDPYAFKPFDTSSWDYTFDRHHHAGVVRFAGPNFLAEISLEMGTQAEVKYPGCDRPSRLLINREVSEVFPAIFEIFFRALVTYRVLCMGGVLMHSAAISDGRRACLFLGRSGAGKSTLSRLALQAGWEVLSDDMNAVLPGPEGWLVERLPLTGEMARSRTRGSCYPVAGLFWLEQAGAHAVRPLSKGLAAARALVCAPVVNEDPFRQEPLLDSIGRIIDAVGMQTLRFERNPGFLDLL